MPGGAVGRCPRPHLPSTVTATPLSRGTTWTTRGLDTSGLQAAGRRRAGRGGGRPDRPRHRTGIPAGLCGRRARRPAGQDRRGENPAAAATVVGPCWPKAPPSGCCRRPTGFSQGYFFLAETSEAATEDTNTAQIDVYLDRCASQATAGPTGTRPAWPFQSDTATLLAVVDEGLGAVFFGIPPANIADFHPDPASDPVRPRGPATARAWTNSCTAATGNPPPPHSLHHSICLQFRVLSPPEP